MPRESQAQQGQVWKSQVRKGEGGTEKFRTENLWPEMVWKASGRLPFVAWNGRLQPADRSRFPEHSWLLRVSRNVKPVRAVRWSRRLAGDTLHEAFRAVPSAGKARAIRPFGRLAQLVRALPSHGRGLGFESLIAHHRSLKNQDRGRPFLSPMPLPKLRRRHDGVLPGKRQQILVPGDQVVRMRRP